MTAAGDSYVSLVAPLSATSPSTPSRRWKVVLSSLVIGLVAAAAVVALTSHNKSSLSSGIQLSSTGTASFFPDGFDGPEEAFSFFDRDADGQISVEELLQDMRANCQDRNTEGQDACQPFTEGEARAAIRMGDTDANGTLDLDEFKAIKSKMDIIAVHEDGSAAEKLRDAAEKLEAGPLPGSFLATELAQLPSASAEQPQPPVSADKVAMLVASNAGEVAGLYTFGAPSSALPALRNHRQEDGCFPGYRIYNEERTAGWFYGYYHKTDPVAWLSTSRLYYYKKHALMKSMALRTFDMDHPVVNPCGDKEADLPARDAYYWVNGHSSTLYKKHAQNQQHYPKVKTMSNFAFMSYDKTAASVMKKSAEINPQRWNLVGRALSTDDPSNLLQDPITLECVLTFAGTDDMSDAITDLAAHGVSFCGFDGVHMGFAAETKRIVAQPSFQENIRSLLPKCRKVYAVGHSLGGAVAELFTACVHHSPGSGEAGYDDFKSMDWEKASPERLPELQNN